MAKINLCHCGKPKKERRNGSCSKSCSASTRWNNPEIREKYIDGMYHRKPKRIIMCPCGQSLKTNAKDRKFCTKICFYKYRIMVIPSNFKGEDVGYDALHDWVNRHLGKANHCSFNRTHKANIYHWANKSHEYKRDLEDWISLCVRCHRKYDKNSIGSKERRFAQ